jgi:hypothetical protein
MCANKPMTRGWQDYWDWKDKSIKECGAAKDILEAAKLKIVDLKAREEKEQPPDCEAFLYGQWSGIEVSELMHRKTNARSIKAKKDRAAGKVPKRAEVFFSWPCDYLLAAIQARIDKKDAAHKVQGGPYERYVLVLHTAEMFLYRDHVERCLEGAARTKFINDVFFGLDYHPADPITKEGGGIPVFRLSLLRR